MTPHTLTLPLPPNLANPSSGRGNWRAAANGKRRYFRQLDGLQNCGLIPPPPTTPYDGVVLDAWMGLGARMDDDNAMLRAYKWPCDWLRTRGYIVDDQQPHCTMHLPIRRIVPVGERRLIITIAPLPRPEGP
jgi:hypothetical protein